MSSVVFVNSHPVQYFVPLYQQIALNKNIALEVVYCSEETIKGAVDKGFATTVKWDIPLLQGYNVSLY